MFSAGVTFGKVVTGCGLNTTLIKYHADKRPCQIKYHALHPEEINFKEKIIFYFFWFRFLNSSTFFYDSSVLFKGSTFSSYFPYNKNSIYLLIALQMFSNFSQNSLNISFSVQKLSRWNAKLFHNSSLNVSKISSNFSKILHRPGGSTTPPPPAWQTTLSPPSELISCRLKSLYKHNRWKILL